MALHAKVVDGVIVARERKENPTSTPASDGGPTWRPIIDELPDHNPVIEYLNGPQEVIEPSRVVQRWTKHARPRNEMIGIVKAAARERIIAHYPEWKQANMTARAVELTRALVENGSWTFGEQTEVAAIDAVWDWIKSVRAASDAIEALDPIPADFNHPSRWPNAPGQ